MTRRLNIIGLGEAILVEYPDRREVAGLGAMVAMQAVRLGQGGVCITRVGQDRAGDGVVEILDEAGVQTEHIQRDPDLATGRLLVRSTGAVMARYLEERAAFDNLQADFDLEDVAQEADAIVYALLTRRSGQTRSEEERFLNASPAAFKLFDLTNREPGALDRRHSRSGLERADAALFDVEAARSIRPDIPGESAAEKLRELIRDARLQFAALCEPDPGKGQQRVTVVTPDGAESGAVPEGRQALVALVVGLINGVLRGLRPEDALDAAARIGAHAVAHPDERVPDEWRDVG